MVNKQADSDYYRQRAAIEWQRAQACSDPRVVACHLELARRYDLLARVGDGEKPAIPLLAA